MRSSATTSRSGYRHATALALVVATAQASAPPGMMPLAYATSLASSDASEGAPGQPCHYNTGNCQDDVPRSLAVDGSGDAFVVGEFRGVMRMGGTVPDLISNGTGTNCYVAKLSPSGSVLLAKSFAAYGNPYGSLCQLNAVTISAAGEIVIGGNFNGNMTLDATEISTYFILHPEQEDIMQPPSFYHTGFVAVLDASLTVLRASKKPLPGHTLVAPHTEPQNLYVWALASIPTGGIVANLGKYLVVFDPSTLTAQHSLILPEEIGSQRAHTVAADSEKIVVTGIINGPDNSFGNAVINGSSNSWGTAFVGVLDTSLSPASAAAVSCTGLNETSTSMGRSIAIDPQSGEIIVGIDFKRGKCAMGGHILAASTDDTRRRRAMAVLKLTPQLTPTWSTVFGEQTIPPDDGQRSQGDWRDAHPSVAGLAIAPSLRIFATGKLCTVDRASPPPHTPCNRRWIESRLLRTQVSLPEVSTGTTS